MNPVTNNGAYVIEGGAAGAIAEASNEDLEEEFGAAATTSDYTPTSADCANIAVKLVLLVMIAVIITAVSFFVPIATVVILWIFRAIVISVTVAAMGKMILDCMRWRSDQGE